MARPRSKPHTGGAQPYKHGSVARLPGLALQAMQRGRTAGGYNPQDVVRGGALYAAAKAARKGRAKRRPRPQRRAR